MSRPGPVSIDDLADPRFSRDGRQILDAMALMAADCPLEAEALCTAAVERTGLDDFGDTAFYDRLALLCQCFRNEAGLSPPGVTTTYLQLFQLLQNRLLLQHLLAAHPEIEEREPVRPIIVGGLPRTGTTHLHNLLAADPSLRSLPYWEALEPVPAPGEEAARPDPRLERTSVGLQTLETLLPYFKRMHEMTVDHAHEEIHLLAIDFSGMYFETMAMMPTWREAYRSTDQTPSYRYLRTVLKALQWLRGGDRWVLKSPQHLEQFGPLTAVFPDATFAVTHRDPVSVTASLLTMLSYSARLAQERVDLRAFGRYWSPRVEELLRACAAEREVLPAERSIDIRFGDFMADADATLHAVYEVAGQPLTEVAREAQTEFSRTHPRGRHGAVVYRLEPFGVDAAERRRALADYSERFEVPDDWAT